jgi:hypothetical protein
VTGKEGTTTFYQLEDGKYKKPGKNWLEMVGSRVEITGSTRKRKDQHFVRVDELKVIATPDQIAPQPNVIGAEAELALKDLFGVEQKLSALRGRVVVLNFWATYCGLSIAKSPNLQKTLDFPAGSQYSRRGNEWFNCLHLGVLLRLQSAS